MSDKRKLRTGNLGANVMEEKKLSKYLKTLDTQIRDKVANSEHQQKILAKKFHERLDQSVALARKQENTTLNFRANRCFQRRDDKEIPLINTRKPEERDLSEETSSPSSVLKKWNQTFFVPYQKEYSFKLCPNTTRPSSVLAVRCKMWQKISDYCLTGRERARSAPPWVRDLRAPVQIQQAHIKALELMEIHKSLVQTPSRQPLIDVRSVRSWREEENKVTCCVVQEFVKSLIPYKLKPGPSQHVHDINSLYRMVSASEPSIKSY